MVKELSLTGRRGSKKEPKKIKEKTCLPAARDCACSVLHNSMIKRKCKPEMAGGLPPAGPTAPPRFFRASAPGFALASRRLVYLSLCIYWRSPVTVYCLLFTVHRSQLLRPTDLLITDHRSLFTVNRESQLTRTPPAPGPWSPAPHSVPSLREPQGRRVPQAPRLQFFDRRP